MKSVFVCVWVWVWHTSGIHITVYTVSSHHKRWQAKWYAKNNVIDRESILRLILHIVFGIVFHVSLIWTALFVCVFISLCMCWRLNTVYATNAHLCVCLSVCHMHRFYTNAKSLWNKWATMTTTKTSLKSHSNRFYETLCSLWYYNRISLARWFFWRKTHEHPLSWQKWNPKLNCSLIGSSCEIHYMLTIFRWRTLQTETFLRRTNMSRKF